MHDSPSRQRIRGQVPEADLDDVIALAHELQAADRAPAGPSVDDVKAVASELDVDPTYVDAAIAALSERRAAAAAAAADAARTRQRWLGGVAAGAAGIAALTVLTIASALPAAWSADRERAEAEAQLRAVIERQAGLAPQLVALAGGEARAVVAAADAVRAAEPTAAKLLAADALGQAMAEQLAAVPADDPAALQLRLNLQYEVTGSANRVATERARYERAIADHAAVTGGLRGRAARALGWID